MNLEMATRTRTTGTARGVGVAARSVAGSRRRVAPRVTGRVGHGVRPRAAAEGKAPAASSEKGGLLEQKKSRESSAAVLNAKSEKKTYYALVANARFLLGEEEHFAEQLREKKRYLREAEIDQDFWIVPNPKFVADNASSFQNVGKPCAALIGTDRVWMRFMKLRLDKVMWVELGSPEDLTKIMSSTGDVPEFEFPSNWSAPYMQYTQGWWRVFVPDEAKDVVDTPDKDFWTDAGQ